MLSCLDRPNDDRPYARPYDIALILDRMAGVTAPPPPDKTRDAPTPCSPSPAMRSKIEAMSYGLAYGLSSFGLSKQLNISVGEASELVDDYFARFGGVRTYLAGVVDEARRTGFTATILGRRRYL